jgi:hypothetical protein
LGNQDVGGPAAGVQVPVDAGEDVGFLKRRALGGAWRAGDPGAGNTGSYGPKTTVDGNGQVIVQALPGTSTFVAWDGTAYTKQTLAVTAATSTSITVA